MEMDVIHSFQIDESTSLGVAVTTVVATDTDAGIDGDLTYSISRKFNICDNV